MKTQWHLSMSLLSSRKSQVLHSAMVMHCPDPHARRTYCPAASSISPDSLLLSAPWGSASVAECCLNHSHTLMRTVSIQKLTEGGYQGLLLKTNTRQLWTSNPCSWAPALHWVGILMWRLLSNLLPLHLLRLSVQMCYLIMKCCGHNLATMYSPWNTLKTKIEHTFPRMHTPTHIRTWHLCLL